MSAISAEKRAGTGADVLVAQLAGCINGRAKQLTKTDLRTTRRPLTRSVTKIRNYQNPYRFPFINTQQHVSRYDETYSKRHDTQLFRGPRHSLRSAQGERDERDGAGVEAEREEQ